ncbi:MAG: adenylate kinase [Deltaproteobacteria bacterium]|nr:adenylate kinase [Deltaproteobacteria bacterium]MBW2308740.1 adenylate kinase [Deltaproteobacteria bacterium]
MKLIMMGPPGAGKGTQAQMLAERFSCPHVSTGDMFREAVKKGSPMGTRAREYMDKGALIPDPIVIGMVEERIDQPDCRNGYILDGFPRTVAQAEALDTSLSRRGAAIDHVINVDVEDAEIVKRLAGRRTCRRCGWTCHVVFDPSKVVGVCDNCGGELFQRADDSEKTVQARLRVYKEQTTPLIQYYQQKGLLRSITGQGSINEIFNRIMEVVDQNHETTSGE